MAFPDPPLPPTELNPRGSPSAALSVADRRRARQAQAAEEAEARAGWAEAEAAARAVLRDRELRLREVIQQVCHPAGGGCGAGEGGDKGSGRGVALRRRPRCLPDYVAAHGPPRTDVES